MTVPATAVNLNGATIASRTTQGLAVPPLGYDLQAGADWISTDGASNARITFHRPFAGKPQTFIIGPGQGSNSGVTFQAQGRWDATGLSVTCWNNTGGAFGAGAVFFVHWIAIYTPGLPASLTLEEFLQKERQE